MTVGDCINAAIWKISKASIHLVQLVEPSTVPGVKAAAVSAKIASSTWAVLSSSESQHECGLLSIRLRRSTYVSAGRGSGIGDNVYNAGTSPDPL